MMCATCKVFPVCGGYPKQWAEGKHSYPSIKYNIEERILIKYAWKKLAKESS
ncbi:MAG: hypothetical protein LBL17_04650 [Coxiellaceae bacterium]|jgi:uncharacterized protein|nr:hypothetical protein [Coxiellaceae bacterium]